VPQSRVTVTLLVNLVAPEARTARDDEDWLTTMPQPWVTVMLLVNLVKHVFLLILTLKVMNAFSY
jgi:hypothetical protein